MNAENRAAAGVSAGDEVDVDVELDTEPREVEVPADFATALNGIPGLRQAFDALAFTHRKEYVRAVEDAKTEETRQRRIAKTVGSSQLRPGALMPLGRSSSKAPPMPAAEGGRDPETRSRQRAKSAYGSRPAASAAPTCTSPKATFRCTAARSFRA